MPVAREAHRAGWSREPDIMLESPPLISVLIPTFNRRNVLERTLPTLFQQDFPADRFEVVVVVDGSSDGTIEFLRKLASPCSMYIVEQPNEGPAAARNAGLRTAHGELILFLDDDILCPPNLLRFHAEAHVGHAFRVAFGPIRISRGSAETLATDFARNGAMERNKSLDAGVLPRIGDLCLDPNSSLPRALLTQLGEFNEEFGAARETADMALRLRSAGAEFFYLRNAVVEHIYLKETSRLARDEALDDGQKEVLLCREHPAYRADSPLAALAEGGRTRIFLRRMIATLSVVDPFIALPLWFCERFRSIGAVQRLGIRLLGWRRTANFLRGATRRAGSWRALIAEFGAALPVLIYHHIGPAAPGTYPELTLSAQRFEQHLRWLTRLGYCGITSSQWNEWRTRARALPHKPVLITFDDAYADNATCAFPLLKRYKFPATVFVVANEVGGTNRWDEDLGSGTHRLMDAHQIGTGAAEGVEFAAHGLTHRDLTEIQAVPAREEIVRSGDLVASLAGAHVSSFAYPYGSVNVDAEAAARSRFDLAFTTEEGLNTLATNPFRLRRTMVLPDDGYSDLVSRLRLGYSLRRKVIAWLSLARRRWLLG